MKTTKAEERRMSQQLVREAIDELDASIRWFFDAEEAGEDLHPFWLDGFFVYAINSVITALDKALFKDEKSMYKLISPWTFAGDFAVLGFFTFWFQKFPDNCSLIWEAQHSLSINLNGKCNPNGSKDNGQFSLRINFLNLKEVKFTKDIAESLKSIAMLPAKVMVDNFFEGLMDLIGDMHDLALADVKRRFTNKHELFAAIRAVRKLYENKVRFSHQELRDISRILQGTQSETMLTNSSQVNIVTTKTNAQISPTHPEPSPPKKKRLPRCGKAGWPITRIAETAGCCPETISRIIKTPRLASAYGYADDIREDSAAAASWARGLRQRSDFKELDKKYREAQKAKRRDKYKKTRYNDSINYDDDRLDK